MSTAIKTCEILEAEIPLKTPYILSFATISNITTIIIRVTLNNGRTGWAEAVPLPGYSEETKDSILSDCQFILPKIMGLSISQLFDHLKISLPNSPFVRSAIFTACELANDSIKIPQRLNLPLLAPISSSQDLQRIGTQVKHFYKQGFRTIKLKTGKDIESDLQTVQFLLQELPDDLNVRIDANQGYSFTDAVAILEALDHPRKHLIELLEQPFGTNEDGWQKFTRLAAQFNTVPLMLDESIFSINDIDRAANCGANFVKLKLFKHQGVQELLEIAEHAVQAGLKVVLGNGVSSDIGNLFEAIAFQESGLFHGAFEGNGFDKLTFPLLRNLLKINKGNLTWDKPRDKSISDLLYKEKLKTVYYQQ